MVSTSIVGYTLRRRWGNGKLIGSLQALDAQHTADNDTSNLMSAASRTHVTYHLENFKQSKVECLTTYISARLQIAPDDRYSLPSEECKNLVQYVTIKDDPEEDLVTAKDADAGHKAKKKMWSKIHN